MTDAPQTPRDNRGMSSRSWVVFDPEGLKLKATTIAQAINTLGDHLRTVGESHNQTRLSKPRGGDAHRVFSSLASDKDFFIR